MRARALLAVVIAGLSLSTALAGSTRDHVVRTANVDVLYEQVNPRFARAIADICQTAREVYVIRFGCEMPKRLTVRVQTGWRNAPTLFGNGRDELVLRVGGDRDLEGSFGENDAHYVYGLCREMGLIAIERTLGGAPWLSGTARQGWCHYAGSVALDEVTGRRGSRVWPGRGAAYRDGLSRLRKQLDHTDAPPLVQTAGAWKRLAEIVQARRIADVFRTWSEAPRGASDPGAAISGLPGYARWHEQARPLLMRDPWSGRARMLAADELAGSPIVLHYDDGRADGRERVGNHGCAMRFDAPAGEWYLRTVRIYCRRNGRSNLKRGDITLHLYDDAMNVLGEFRQSSRQLRQGASRWHRIGTPPIRVSDRFLVCVQLDDRALPDVTVHTDASAGGQSFLMRPGTKPAPLAAGNWMIRVELDRPRSHDPLRPHVEPPSLMEQQDREADEGERLGKNTTTAGFTNPP